MILFMDAKFFGKCSIFITLVCIMIIQLDCNGKKKKVELKVDKIFEGDSPFSTDNRTKISEDNLPIPGVTKESEFERLYPGGYASRMTFLYVREKTFEGKKIRFNRTYFYIEAINKNFSEPGRSGYVGLERKFLGIFVLDGIVQDYVLNHYARDYKSKDPYDHWVRGPLANYDSDKYSGEDWPDANKDFYDYFVQPGNHIRKKPDDLKATLESETHYPGVKTRILYPKKDKKK